MASKSAIALGLATKTISSSSEQGSLREAAGSPPSGAPIVFGDDFVVDANGIDEPLPLGQYYRVGSQYTFSARFGDNGDFVGELIKHDEYYSWSAQDATIISEDGDEVTVQFTTHGTKTITMTYDDGFNDSQSPFIAVGVRQPLPDASIIDVTGDGVEGHRADIVVDFDDADHWEVTWGDGGKTEGTSNSTQLLGHTYTSEGDFDIVARAWNIHGESTTDTYADFTSVADPPTLSNVSVTKSGNTVNAEFDYTDVHFPITSITIHWDRNDQGPQHVYHWEDANGSTSGHVDETHNYGTSSHPFGDYRVYIVVENSAGKTATYGTTKTDLGVIGDHAPVVTITSTTVIAGNVAEVTFTATDQDGDIESWEIDWGDGSTTSGNPSMESSLNITRQHDYSPNSAFGQQVGVVVVDSKSNFDGDTAFIF